MPKLSKEMHPQPQKKRMPWEGLSYEEKIAKNVYCVFSLPKEDSKTPKSEIGLESKSEPVSHADRIDIINQHILNEHLVLRLSNVHIEIEYTD